MKRTAVAVTLLFVVVLLAALATYVWPTRYRYSPGTNSRPRVLLVRVDRFTGAAEALQDVGWVRCEDPFNFVLPPKEVVFADTIRLGTGR